MGFNKISGLSKLAMIAVIGATFWQGPVFAQDAASGDLQTLLNRLERVERDIRTMNVQINRGDVAAPTAAAPTPPKPAPVMTEEEANSPAAARFAIRLGAVEEQLQYSTGEMERVSHEIRLINDRLDKLISDLDYRLNAMEQGRSTGQSLAASQPGTAQETAPARQNPGVAGVSADGTYKPAEAEAARMTGAGATDTADGKVGSYDTGPKTLGTVTEEQLKNVKDNAAGNAGNGTAVAEQNLAAPAESQPNVAALPNGSPKEQYKHAFRLLRKSEYDQAEKAWKMFLEKNPKDPLADNARYWLGETYYVRAQYVEAAETFLEGYQANPESLKAPDVLLKLGMSLANLDKKEEACASFSKLQKDYPKASDQIKAKVAREITSNGC